jgi:hypothetical protein
MINCGEFYTIIIRRGLFGLLLPVSVRVERVAARKLSGGRTPESCVYKF